MTTIRVEGGGAKANLVMAEMVNANVNGRAPYGENASGQWLRTCSDNWLECVVDDDDESFRAAMGAVVTLRAWEFMNPKIEAYEDDLVSWRDKLAVAAAMEMARRAGVIDINKPVGLWVDGGFELRLTDKGIDLGVALGDAHAVALKKARTGKKRRNRV